VLRFHLIILCLIGSLRPAFTWLSVSFLRQIVGALCTCRLPHQDLQFPDPPTIFTKLISSIMSSSTSSPSGSPPGSPSERFKPLEAPTMPAGDRTLGRDVLIYDANDPDEVLGGLVLTNGVTNANFYSMVEIMIIFGGGFSLLDESGTKIDRDDCPLQPGNYFIDTDGRLLYSTHSSMITWLIDKQIPSKLITSRYLPAHLLSRRELVSMSSVTLSVSEMADALYQGQEQFMLGEDAGEASRLHTSFH